MSPDKNDKTPAETPRSKTPAGGMPVSRPPRPDGTYSVRPGTPIGAISPPSDAPKIAENRDADEAHPRLDRAPSERTWNVRAKPRLAADSLRQTATRTREEIACLASIEDGALGAKERARQGAEAVRELKLEFFEFKAGNAGEHAQIHTTVGMVAHKVDHLTTKIDQIQEDHPKTLRSTRIWNTVAGAFVVAAAFWGWLTAHEHRLAQQELTSAASSAHLAPARLTPARR